MKQISSPNDLEPGAWYVVVNAPDEETACAIYAKRHGPGRPVFQLRRDYYFFQEAGIERTPRTVQSE